MQPVTASNSTAVMKVSTEPVPLQTTVHNTVALPNHDAGEPLRLCPLPLPPFPGLKGHPHLQQISLDDFLLLAKKLRHIPVAADVSSSKPVSPFRSQEGQGVARQLGGIAHGNCHIDCERSGQFETAAKSGWLSRHPAWGTNAPFLVEANFLPISVKTPPGWTE